MENKKWNNRDWFWLVGILVGIMILMVAGFFNSDRVEMNFSIISSAVSIALAIIAIAIALRQASDNQLVNINVSNLLNQIEANLRNVDEKVNNLDIGKLNQVKEETVEDFKIQNESKENYTATEVKELVENLGNNLTEKFLNMSIEKDINQIKRLTPRSYATKAGLIRQMIKESPNFSPLEIQKELKELHDLDVTLATILAHLNNIRDEKNKYGTN